MSRSWRLKSTFHDAERVVVEKARCRFGQQRDKFDSILRGHVSVLAFDLQFDGVLWLEVVTVFLEEHDRLVTFDLLLAGVPLPLEMLEQESGPEVVTLFGCQVVAFGEVVPGQVVDDRNIVFDRTL